jgi:hypothetical protein
VQQTGHPAKRALPFRKNPFFYGIVSLGEQLIGRARIGAKFEEHLGDIAQFVSLHIGEKAIADPKHDVGDCIQVQNGIAPLVKQS